MADLICRSLRDGAIEGEHSPALTIKDSLQCPLGTHAFNYFLCSLYANLLAGKSQARGLVVVASNQSPSSYFSLLKSKGLDAFFTVKHLRVLDCYSDPLGWKAKLFRSENAQKSAEETDSVCRDVKDVHKLFSLIMELGKEVASEGKSRFAIAIDSVNTMLRHASLQSLVGLISNLRSHDQVSCMLWLLHTDLHEPRTTAALEYVSTMVACLEPTVQIADRIKSSKSFWLGKHSQKGRFHVRSKRRNGRVKLLNEEFIMEQTGIVFVVPSSEDVSDNQNVLPKLQFNLQLSEKERDDKARVVLPFEHQGNGEPIQLYGGRRPSMEESRMDLHLQLDSLSVEKEAQREQSKGEIHYLRDSDDEQPDSDEDPDDDLDI
ncbi:hypothetical protein HPP92_018385 [Vanilla planifolia]|uniref:Elongator complex protein 5 n=1 Tax=Vanilla planifolia TaxID=51239 RepID=A0A835UPB9_VANPL|nr:hypothetical protein HPP92_018385 [Vanilla planifolia]